MEKMIELDVAVTTELGCHIYTSIKVREDYTMNEVVQRIRDLDYVSFRLIDTMKGYARV